MLINGQQLKQAEIIAKKEPVVQLLIDEIRSYDEDVAKLYYTTLAEAIRWVCHQIKNKTIDLEDPYTKAVLKLAESGDKVFNTLQRGKQDVSPAEVEASKVKTKANNVPT